MLVNFRFVLFVFLQFWLKHIVSLLGGSYNSHLLLIIEIIWKIQDQKLHSNFQGANELNASGHMQVNELSFNLSHVTLRELVVTSWKIWQGRSDHPNSHLTVSAIGQCFLLSIFSKNNCYLINISNSHYLYDASYVHLHCVTIVKNTNGFLWAKPHSRLVWLNLQLNHFGSLLV